MPKLEDITSKENPHIKLLRQLAQKKYRHQEQKFVVENFTIIHDAFEAGFKFQALFVTDEFMAKHPEQFAELFNKDDSSQCYVVSEQLNKHFSQLDTPSGIAAIYEMQQSALDPKKSVVYLNGVSDPGNVGTIMRTALAFDAPNIVVDINCADIYNFKTIHAAKDAIFKMHILEDREATWLEENKSKLTLYAASTHDGKKLSAIKPVSRFCLVLGSESHGISEDILNLVHEKIKIQISNQIESLNVSAAAAILLCELNGNN